MPLDVPRYINDLIESSDVLSHSEQAALAEAAINGCEKSRDKLIICNLRMIMREIRSLATIPVRLEFADIFNAGVEGMLEALARFDCTRDIKFMTYAYWWVKKKIVNTVYDNLSIIHIPKEQVKALERLHALCDKKIQRIKNRNPYARVPNTALEMAEEIFRTDESGSYMRLQCAFSAFDINVIEHDDTGDIQISTTDESEETSLSDEVTELLGYLTEREEDIIKRHFGFGCKAQDYDEIGMFYILTPERIRQIVQESLEKMRTASPSPEAEGCL